MGRMRNVIAFLVLALAFLCEGRAEAAEVQRVSVFGGIALIVLLR